jgi:hypothetical protein
MKRVLLTLVVGGMLFSGINSYAWKYNYKRSKSQKVEKKWTGWGAKASKNWEKIKANGKKHTRDFKTGFKSGNGSRSRSASNGARAKQAVENTKSAFRGFFKGWKKKKR